MSDGPGNQCVQFRESSVRLWKCVNSFLLTTLSSVHTVSSWAQSRSVLSSKLPKVQDHPFPFCSPQNWWKVFNKSSLIIFIPPYLHNFVTVLMVLILLQGRSYSKMINTWKRKQPFSLSAQALKVWVWLGSCYFECACLWAVDEKWNKIGSISPALVVLFWYGFFWRILESTLWNSSSSEIRNLQCQYSTLNLTSDRVFTLFRLLSPLPTRLVLWPPAAWIFCFSPRSHFFLGLSLFSAHFGSRVILRRALLPACSAPWCHCSLHLPISNCICYLKLRIALQSSSVLKCSSFNTAREQPCVCLAGDGRRAGSGGWNPALMCWVEGLSLPRGDTIL